jgi:hypothetical protein
MGEKSFSRRALLTAAGVAILYSKLDGKPDPASASEYDLSQGRPFNSLDGSPLAPSNGSAAPLDPTALDPEVGLPLGIVSQVIAIEQESRIPWFVIASYHHHLVTVSGGDPKTNMDQKFVDRTRATFIDVGQQIFSSNTGDGKSLYTALDEALINQGRPFHVDNVLQHALGLRQRFIDTGREKISTGKLPNGLVDVYGIRVAPVIADGLKRLIDESRAAGLELGGWGARTMNTQVEARYKNRCGSTVEDIFVDPARTCGIPTAQPGKSMHERGLAIDFTIPTKDGGLSTVQRGSKENAWLMANAPKFGLFNLPSEAWHYSIDGR